jgi:hypothetical protein
MKKSNVAFTLGACLMALLSFKAKKFEPNVSYATVNKMEGLYIFTDSTPLTDYDTLGVVEIGFVTGTQYESIRGNLINRTREKYPNANGLILKLDKKGVDQGVAIKLKN